ncbi:MAG: ACT domain-containing protein [Candidatus ainarchaeum sp.]|nr:ACT domain-containing protein [Candidatus ainarchaeum sp.]
MAGKELAVITAFGKDRTGLVAGVSRVLAENGVNIEDLSQTIMQDMFAMMILVDIGKSSRSFDELQEMLSREGGRLGLEVRIMHKDIFERMHRV